MPIEDFLVDFYSKNTDQEIDQAKIDSIINHYDGDNASMMKDLYEKYDTGNIDNNKFLEIKEYYSIDLPKQDPSVKDVSNPDFDYTTIINDKKNAFDQGEFKMAEREAYDAYKETGEIDLTLLPKEEVESARKYKYNEIGGEYYVDNVKLSRVELKDKLYDRDFIDKLQGGKVDIKTGDTINTDHLKFEIKTFTLFLERIKQGNKKIPLVISGLSEDGSTMVLPHIHKMKPLVVHGYSLKDDRIQE